MPPFQDFPSHLRNSLRNEAGRVWRDKAQAKKLGLQLNEETITETVLFRLALSHQRGGLVIRTFTKPQETKIGADWEWWFVHQSNGVGLRVQAKRLFSSGTYQSLKPRSIQTTNLIANSRNCHPVFVFYNDQDSVDMGLGSASSLPFCPCRFYNLPSYWGCTVSSAYAIEKAPGNGLSTLLPLMQPWHCLICPSSTQALFLPDIVAVNLNKELTHTDGRRTTVGRPPTWVSAILEQGSEITGVVEDNLYRYLEERALSGVVLFNADREREQV
jgi:hypothetical protein